jgi:hypothetical protein
VNPDPANVSLYLVVGHFLSREDVPSATARYFLRSVKPNDSVGVADVSL